MDRAAIEPNRRVKSEVGSLEIRSGKSEVGSGKSEVGNRRSEVRSGKSEVRSGKWEVGSGKWELGGQKSNHAALSFNGQKSGVRTLSSLKFEV